MRTITKNIYTFSELTEDAKETALEYFRNSRYQGFAWVDEWVESVKKGLENFGAELKDWHIDCLSINTSSWKIVNNNDNTDEITGIRLRTWLLNNYYSNFYQRKPQGEYKKDEKTGKWNYKRRSKVIYVETICPFTGYCGDECFMDAFRQFIANPDGRTLYELLEDATEKTFREMEADCERQLTEEYLREFIEANEYEFDKDGNLA